MPTITSPTNPTRRYLAALLTGVPNTITTEAHAKKSFDGSAWPTVERSSMLTMLHSKKLSSALCLLELRRGFCCTQAWPPITYCKLHYIMRRHKSSSIKGASNITCTEEYAESQCGQQPNDNVPCKPCSQPPESNKHFKIIKYSPVRSPIQQQKLVKASNHIDRKEIVKRMENKDDNVSEIGIASVSEVLQSVRGELYDGNLGAWVPQLVGRQAKNRSEGLVKGAAQHSNDRGLRILYRKRQGFGNSSNSKKKIVILKNKKKLDNGDLAIALCDAVVTEDTCLTLEESSLHAQGDQRKDFLEERAAAGRVDCDLNVIQDQDVRNKHAEAHSKPLATETSQSFRKNALSIQMLSLGLFNQLFREVSLNDGQDSQDDMKRSRDHLEAHGLWDKTPSVVPDVDLKLPQLENEDLDQHFRIIAEEQCVPYKELLNQLVGADLPCFPPKWEFTPGWTRYNPDGSSSPVDYPECLALVFDVEVCVREGNQPTLATAVSDKHWYSWCCKALIDPSYQPDDNSLRELIPLEASHNLTPTGLEPPRVVVGHNVSYDRLRVREQYMLEGTRLRFVDTMSLHIAVSGLVSEQRALLLKNKSSEKKIKLPWMSAGCQNSLNNVYKFYCHTKEELDKSTRNIFVDGNINNVREDFQNLMSYCANDVKATHMVLVKLLPLFFERFPHPVTFSGMLDMGQTFLPVTKNWTKYIESAESEYHQVERQLNEELVKQAQNCLGYMEGKSFEDDLWLWSLDWAVPKGRVKKLPGYPNWYRKLCARTGEREGTPEPENMSTSLQVVPKILKLTWNGFPLHYERKYGWGYLKPLYQSFSDIPQSEWDICGPGADNAPVFPVKALYEMCFGENMGGDDKGLQEAAEMYEDELEWKFDDDALRSRSYDDKMNKRAVNKEEGINLSIPGVGFVPLPHKDGAGYRVGNPLAKDFLNKIEDGTLSSHLGNVAELVLKTNKSLSYWKNNRDRILSQMVVWSDQSTLPLSVTSAGKYERSGRYGVILPMVVPAGTITRRAVEPTWMTASNAYPDRIGSELKAMVEAPPGHKFVGADVDSQELWIAAVLGDAYFTGEHGATALGWMTLQGKKSDGTDMHSHTARNAGISRDHAKVINYGRIYGAGLKFTQRLLKQFNPRLTEREAKEQAEHLFASTKGEKGWYLSEAGERLALELGYYSTGEPLSRKKISRLLWQARENNIETSFAEVVEKPPVWIGGSESHMFNCLEAIARCPEPKTPVLGARLTRALEPHMVDDQFMTSRVNWVVQSSAVDYLHIMLVCMQWLFTKYNISGRFCISIHDEVRYLVTEDDCYRAALALQITNLLTRAYFAHRLGFKDLPQSVAFFSGVDIDQVLRKEPHLDCVTPSNPQGLKKGYDIHPGITLDIHQIIDITQGKLTKTISQ